MAKYGIGQAITRREDQRLITGTGQYVDDIARPGEAHAVLVRSPHAHARIAGIDTQARTCRPMASTPSRSTRGSRTRQAIR
jgi:carbon-monoxide dehydrogenase large subunit